MKKQLKADIEDVRRALGQNRPENLTAMQAGQIREMKEKPEATSERVGSI